MMMMMRMMIMMRRWLLALKFWLYSHSPLRLIFCYPKLSPDCLGVKNKQLSLKAFSFFKHSAVTGAFFPAS